MEMVAWLAGEPHSDEPRCACPVLGAFVRAFNDLLPDACARDRWLRPIVPRLVHTRGTREQEEQRAFRALDCAVRELAPQCLAAAGRHDDAAVVRALPPIVDRRHAAAAAALLGPLGPVVRAAAWTAAQAAAVQHPRVWVAGVVHQVKAAGAWGAATRLLRELVAVSPSPATEKLDDRA
jgi:hypothetical protein